MQQGLVLHYTLHPDGAHLVRVLGDTPCPVLPETLGGVPITQIGAYAFSASSQKAVADGEQLEEICGPAPAAAAPLCGAFLEGVVLPDSVRVLGNAAFYNCRNLQSLEIGPDISGVGSDMFTNCRSLHRLVIRAMPDQSTGLRRVINALSEDIEVQFRQNGTTLAGLRYPEFWEQLEENAPAHIFQRGIQGRGYHYRQCFADEALNFSEFDGVFSMAVAEEDPAVMVGLAFDRLRWPWALSAEAKERYCDYLRQHGGLAACNLIHQQDLNGLEMLCGMDVLSADAVADALALARKQGAAQAAAILTRSNAPAAAAPKTYEF